MVDSEYIQTVNYISLANGEKKKIFLRISDEERKKLFFIIFFVTIFHEMINLWMVLINILDLTRTNSIFKNSWKNQTLVDLRIALVLYIDGWMGGGDECIKENEFAIDVNWNKFECKLKQVERKSGYIFVCVSESKSRTW